ncbi:DUF4405 domain-containing protein [Rhizobium sp. LjRoot258]|uniref:DUF4405 domain-containing protein n=1 Tax=Rhizobium sp. LjRoot258 TaxID=3342299 RepID=UPI003ECFBC30
MFRVFLLQRIALPTCMLALLLLSLAYWWLDNVPHELFGTGLFVLLCWHIYLNRAWFRKLRRGTYDSKRAFEVALHLGLIANMAVLSITSVVISKTVLASLPIPDFPYLREIHWFSAYWVVVATGIHVGLHWERSRAGLFNRLGVNQSNRALKTILWGIGTVALVQGVSSFRILGVWTKLTFNYSLEFWDFTASVAPFFAHWIAVFMIPAVLTHIVMVAWRRRGRRRKAIRPVGETQVENI